MPHKEHQLRKVGSIVLLSFKTRFYQHQYIWGMDYKGLNAVVTYVIYHMSRYIRAFANKKISKHHAHIMSITHPWSCRVSTIRIYAWFLATPNIKLEQTINIAFNDINDIKLNVDINIVATI
jgi:hypothetical protein